MIALDIETIGRVPGEPDDSPRVQVARGALGEQATAEEIDRYLALSVSLARPVAVALATPTRTVVNLDGTLLDIAPSRTRDYDVRPHDGERELLRAVAGQLDTLGAAAMPIVTFNGARFDLPALRLRMAAHRLPQPRALRLAGEQKPWETDHHIDLMVIMGRGAALSLRAACVGVLGIDPKAGGCGADVAGLVAERDGSALAAYNVGDARACLALLAAWKASAHTTPQEAALRRET